MAQELSPETRSLVKSRIANYDKLTPEEQLRAAIIVIKDDFYIYAERNLAIQDKLTSDLIPLTRDNINWAQKILIDRVMEDLALGRPVRYIILKARQMGISTIIEAICFWWTATHKRQNSVIIAHESDASGNLYEMFRLYYENCHAMFQPRRKYNSKKELVFDVVDEIKEEYLAEGKEPPGLRSQIKTMVAKAGKGRSSTINFFHGSEVAFWEKGADVKASALQAIPMRKNTFAFLESTANGIGGYYYDEWQFAKKGESTFRPLFFAWHEHPEYELDVPETGIGAYNDEEQALMSNFEDAGYPRELWDRKIMWRREKQKEFRAKPEEFYQEYPKDDMEAFLSSGRPRFDTAKLVKMEEFAAKHSDHSFGEIVASPDTDKKDEYIFEEHPVIFQDQDPTPLKVWELPIKADSKLFTKDEKYVIGVDVSEGKINTESTDKKNDYSVIDVMKQSDLKTVARWRGHIDPDLLGAIVYKIGTYYNNALVGVEVNNHGLTTIQHLRNHFYRNLYMRETNEENQFQERTAVMGWRTDRKTKPIIINNLATAIREGDIIDLDIVFIRECMTYVRDDQGHTDAQAGMFDDTVMAKAIALQMSDFNAIDVQYAKDKITKPVKRNKYASSSSTSNDIELIASGGKRRSSTSEAVQRRRTARAAHRQRRG